MQPCEVTLALTCCESDGRAYLVAVFDVVVDDVAPGRPHVDGTVGVAGDELTPVVVRQGNDEPGPQVVLKHPKLYHTPTPMSSMSE